MALIAGSVEVEQLLNRLRESRPVFHSEADFQHALAWEAHRLDPLLQVRLETHPEPNVRLDLLLSRPEQGRHTAVELKYLSAAWAGEVEGEQYALKSHGAQDIRGYDVVKDIARLERFVNGRAGWNGVFIALSNDSAYWQAASHRRVTNADAFRLHEGSVLTGERAWGPNTGGTMKGRADLLLIRGEYRMSWRDYSRRDGRNGSFRSLLVEVAGG